MKSGTILLMGLMLCPAAASAGDINHDIIVKLTVPDRAWKISIEEVYRVKDEIWVISLLERSPMMAAQVISTVTDKVSLTAPDLPEKHFILGKTWNWENKEPYTFLKDRKEIETQLKTASLLYKKPKEEK